MTKNIILLILLSLFINSCSQAKKQKEKSINRPTVESIIKDSLIHNLNYQNVYYLSERGCHNCNKSFSEFLISTFSDKNLYIIGASGQIVDISFYMDKQADNIVFDEKDYLETYTKWKGSTGITIQNGKIDTIIELNSDSLIQQFKYFENAHIFD